MLYALAGIVIGFAAGWYFPLYLPFEYARLLSVSLMAALDTVFGGMRSSMEGKYDNTVFITGFFYQCCFGSVFVLFRYFAGIDLYLVAILIFGMRIF